MRLVSPGSSPNGNTSTTNTVSTSQTYNTHSTSRTSATQLTSTNPLTVSKSSQASNMGKSLCSTSLFMSSYLCRYHCIVCLLNSSSPVIIQWKPKRGETQFSKTTWQLLGSKKQKEQENNENEHRLIACGSRKGAQRTDTFNRVRNGEVVYRSEIHYYVEEDTERLPRRGFSMKMRVDLLYIPNTAIKYVRYRY